MPSNSKTVTSFDVFDSDRVVESRHKRYNESPKGQSRNAAYRGEKRKEYRSDVSEQKYLTKPFRAWDGEGGDEEDGSHTYFILASSDGHIATDRNGLGTVRVFDLWLSSASDDVTNVIYGGNYDFNMVLRDVPKDKLEEIYSEGHCYWNQYRIEWRPGKHFRVSTKSQSFKIYDVLPFFQRAFVAACDEYLGNNWPFRDEIIDGKKRRGSFDWSQINEVGEYNAAELQNLVALCNELRQRLYRVDIRVSRWDGPGAIAGSLFKKYETKSHYGESPDEVSAAGRHGYSGGRFEIVRQGHSVGRAFQYDINSAYPHAIRKLPCLAHGKWVHISRPDPLRIDPDRFGIYRVEYSWEDTDTHPSRPQPFFMRWPNGAVSYPLYSHGWYWAPEAALAPHVNATVHEGWVWLQECDEQPFAWVEALYNKRAALKKAGDGAHVGLKLGLNSLYGKLAQQIGWRLDPKKGLVIPPYHCLEWAGYVTSYCRSMVFGAAMLAPDDVIAFETDAVFMRVPLDLPVSNRLGEWEGTEYSSLTYLKSGMYYGTLVDGSPVEKSRGVNKGSITRNDAIAALMMKAKIPAEQTRFVGLGIALAQNFALWRHWVTVPKMIATELGGKRVNTVEAMGTGKDLRDGWAETYPLSSPVAFSQPYEVEWINPRGSEDPDWREYDERWNANDGY